MSSFERSKLFQLLAGRSKDELVAFRRYLLAPLSNAKPEEVGLYDELVDNGAILKRLNKKEVYSKLVPGQSYEDIVLRRLSSGLTRRFMEFLAYQSLNEEETDLRALEQLQSRQFEKHFKGLFRRLERRWKKKDHFESEDYLKMHRTYRLLHQQEERQSGAQKSIPHLEKADYYLDVSYVLQKLKHYCDAILYRQLYDLEARVSLPPGFFQYLESKAYSREPLVEAYTLVARMQERPEEEARFFELKELLSRSTNIPDEELKALFTYLNNYCILYKINAGAAAFFKPLFESYQTMLERGLFFHEGKLNPQDYKNIITVGLQVEAFSWVERFIQEQTAHLPAGDQENALNYNLAKLYFHQKAFEKVIQQLQSVAYSTHVYALGSKLFLLRAYYELQEFLALDALIESFRIYLRREKRLAPDIRQQYNIILRLVRKLSRIQSGNPESIKKLKEEIQSCPSVVIRDWLSEKIEAIK